MDANQKKSVRKVLLKLARMSFWVISVIVAIFLVLSMIIYFSRDKIKQFVIDEINKKLLAEIQVGDVDLTIFSTFPYVAIVFEDVVIPEVIHGKHGENTLINAHKVLLQFNFWDILRKKYILRRVNVENAQCEMKILKDGSSNYMFWRTDTVGTDNSDFKLWLSKVRLDEVAFRYSNVQSDIGLSLYAEKFVMSGAFYEQNFDLSFSGNLHSEFLRIGKNQMLVDLPVVCTGKMFADTEVNSYEFMDASMDFKGVRLYLNGKYMHGEIPFVDFLATNDKCKLLDLETLLPEDMLKQLDPFSKKGNILIDARISGPISKSKMPAFSLKLILEQGVFARKESDVELENLYLTLTYKCADILYPEVSELVCKEFNGELGTGKLNGNFKVSGFKKSIIEFELNSDIDLNDIQGIFQFSDIENISGRLKCNLKFNGSFADLQQISVSDFLDAASEGTVYSEKIDLKLTNFNEVITLIDLNARFTQKDLLIDKVIVKSCASDIVIKGIAYNIFPFLLLNDQQLYIKGSGKSDLIYVDRMLASNTVSTSDKEIQKGRIDFLEKIRLDLDIKVKDLYYDTFKASDISSHLILNNKLMLLRDMTFTSMDGSAEAEVIIDARPADQIEFRVMAVLKNVNITKAFRDLNNFGQTSMTDKNLKGILSGTVHFSSVWTKELEIDMKSVTVVADVEIENGSIRNYEPLSGLNKYLRRRDFTVVEFATLSNQIIIRNEEILIPQMMIQSSVMDFEMQGVHYFDNRINYNFKIQFDEFIRKNSEKSKPQVESEYGTIQENNENKLLWHFKVTGTVDNPRFVPLDLQSVTTKAKDDFKKEGQKAVEILQKEFGNKKDSTEKLIEHEDEKNKKLFIIWEDE